MLRQRSSPCVRCPIPRVPFHGFKHRLLPWIHGVLRTLRFQTAADPFVGSGCVAYLLKAMGKRVIASDFLNFPTVVAAATIVNSSHRLDGLAVKRLLVPITSGPRFIEETFAGIFFTLDDLRFLDRVSTNINSLEHPAQRALASSPDPLVPEKTAAGSVHGLWRSFPLQRRQRDLRLTIEEHFLEQIEIFNRVVFDNGHLHSVDRADVFSQELSGVDLVYLDPPYVPRSDDNCYMKRYHFLEGLSCYWKGVRILEETKVKKIEKPYTPFSYRKTATESLTDYFACIAIASSCCPTALTATQTVMNSKICYAAKSDGEHA